MAIFVSSGKVPFLIEKFIMFVKGLVITCALIFINLDGILSYTGETFVFNLFIMSTICFSEEIKVIVNEKC